MVATFMPKPFAGHRTGSGLHLHLSLTSAGTLVFPRWTPRRVDERAVWGCPHRVRVHRRHPRPRASALQSVIAPTVNSTSEPGPPTARRILGPRTPTYGGNVTARTTSACRTTSASSCAAATARPTHIWRSRRHWAPDWTGSNAARTLAWSVPRPTVAAPCRPPCCTPWTHSRPTRW